MGYVDGFWYILLQIVKIIYAVDRPLCMAEVRSSSIVRVELVTYE